MLLFPGGPEVQVRLVTALRAEEVFVVPTNDLGIHGMGAAGMAFRGSADRCYAQDPVFQRAARAPIGHPDRIGRWAIYGVGRGGMVGREGKSYGVATLAAPGKRGTITPQDLHQQCATLAAHARRRPDLVWLVPLLGTGLARRSWEEFSSLWQAIQELEPLSSNLKFVCPPQ